MAIPCLNLARAACRVVWLPDGRIFAIGGYAGEKTGFSNSVEMTTREYFTDGVVARIWHNKARMLNARSTFAAVIAHGLILVAGGWTVGNVKLSSVECFTPPAASDPSALGQWTSILSMPSPMVCLAGVASGKAVFVFRRLILLHEPSKVKTYNVATSFLPSLTFPLFLFPF